MSTVAGNKDRSQGDIEVPPPPH